MKKLLYQNQQINLKFNASLNNRIKKNPRFDSTTRNLPKNLSSSLVFTPKLFCASFIISHESFRTRSVFLASNVKQQNFVVKRFSCEIILTRRFAQMAVNFTSGHETNIVGQIMNVTLKSSKDVATSIKLRGLESSRFYWLIEMRLHKSEIQISPKGIVVENVKSHATKPKQKANLK